MFRENNLFLARLPGILSNSKKTVDVVTSRSLLIFPEISRKLNFWKIYNPSHDTWQSTVGCFVISICLVTYIILYIFNICKFSLSKTHIVSVFSSAPNGCVFLPVV